MRFVAARRPRTRRALELDRFEQNRARRGRLASEHGMVSLQRDIGNQAVQRLLRAEPGGTRVLRVANGAPVLQRKGDTAAKDKAERERWEKALKGRDLPSARQYGSEKEMSFFVEGLIETSKVLAPYLKGKLGKSVAKNFHIYGSREVFDAKARKLVGKDSSPGTKYGGFFDRPSDSIHLPPRAAFGHALHEGIHKYSEAVVKGAFGITLNEGVTQYFADRVQAEHGVEGKAENEYGDNLECAKIVLSWLPDGEKTLAEAYFQGKVTALDDVIRTKLRLTVPQRAKLVGDDKLCERIKKKGAAK